MSPQEIDKVKQQFVNSGFIELPLSKSPKSLLWQPDLVLSKDSHTYLVLIKSNNSVLPSFLNRIASIRSDKTIPLIVFAQKVNPQKEKEILGLGISIGYYFHGKIINLRIKTKKAHNTVKKEIKKLKHIDIFVSSKQNGNDGLELSERTLAKRTIKLLHETMNYPFSPPHCIEYDKFPLTPKKLKEKIDNTMNICEWVIIILEDNYTKTVSYEINKSIRDKDHRNIFVFRKQTLTCIDAWKNETKKIEKLNPKIIKHLPYSDLSDLEVTMTRAINTRMTEICKGKRIEIFA